MEYRDQFRIPPAFLIVLGISLTTTLTIIVSVGWTDLAAFFQGNPTEEGATLFYVLLGVIALEVGVGAIIMAWCRLHIHAGGIGVIYRPFVWSWKWRKWSEVQSITIAKLSPIGDFGGWGLRVNSFGAHKNVHAYAFDEGVYALFALHSGRTVAFQIRNTTLFNEVLQSYAPDIPIEDPKNLLALQA